MTWARTNAFAFVIYYRQITLDAARDKVRHVCDPINQNSYLPNAGTSQRSPVYSSLYGLAGP